MTVAEWIEKLKEFHRSFVYVDIIRQKRTPEGILCASYSGVLPLSYPATYAA